MRALGTMRRFLAEAFLWLLPLIVVAEWVGTTFGDTLWATSVLFAVFAGVLWITPPEGEPGRAPRWLVWVGRALGLGALAAGVWLMARALLPLLDPKHFPMPPIGTYRQREVFLYGSVLAAYPVALGARLIRGRARGRDLERLGLLMALVLLAHQIGKQRVQFLPVLPYARPDLDTITTTAALVLVALCFVPRVPPFVRVLALLGAGLGLRFVGLETWKLDPSTRDMLPLVKSAQDAFLSGANPYGLHQMQANSVVPLTYLPGMWLVWGVPRFLGAQDFRVMGLVADAAVVLGTFWAASGVRAEWRERAQGAAAAFGAVWLFSPSVAWNGIYAEPHAWWLVLSLTLATTLRKKWWLAAAFLGLALATRHFAAVVAPFVLLAMLRELGLRRALPKLALTGVVAAALLVPFVARNPDAFWFGTLRWLVEYGPVHQGWFWEKFGFSGPLYKANATVWMPRAQIALPGVMLLCALFLRGARRTIAPAGTAYVLFVMFNGIIWDSFYLGCALFAAFAAAGGRPLEAAPEPGRPSRRGLAVAAVAFALSAGAAGWLGFTLWVSQSHAGAALVRQHLEGVLRPGDALVDRAEWEVAFIRGKRIFDGAPPPAPTARDPLDPVLGPHGALGHERAWFVLRAGRENDLLRQIRSLGAPFEDRRFGHYRLLGVAGLGVGGTLAGHAGSSAPRPCRLAGAVRSMAGAAPERGRPSTLAWRVPLRSKLVLVAGLDDSAMVWGRKPVRLQARIDGKAAGALTLPNLPGGRFLVIDTPSGEHDLELSLSTRDPLARTVCVDGWVLGRAN